jgi:RNA recognition motif-containing protein
MSRQTLLEGFRSLVPGIVELDVTMQKDQGKPDENRGFCFIEMYNQASAEQAIAKLTVPDLELAGECVPMTPVLVHR